MSDEKKGAEVVALGTGRLVDAHAALDEFIAKGATGLVLIAVHDVEADSIAVDFFGEGSCGALVLAGELIKQKGLDLFLEEYEGGDDDEK